MGMKDAFTPGSAYTYHMQAASFCLGSYPLMEELLENRQERLDQLIVDFYRGSEEIGEGLQQLQWGITDWLGCQEMDAPARAEFREMSQDPAFIRLHLEDRIAYLCALGRLGPACTAPLALPLQRHAEAAPAKKHAASHRTLR